MVDEEGEILGKHLAFVTLNNELIPDPFELQPYEGCIKVVCPDLYGWESQPFGGLPFAALKEFMIESGWIKPCWSHPMDAYIPSPGEGVYIEGVAGRGLEGLIYTGFYPGEEFINFYTLQLSEGLNKNMEAALPGQYDRVIGARDGSHLKFEDDPVTGIGKTVLMAGGKKALNPIQVGPSLELDPFTALEKAILKTTDKIGALENVIMLDMTPPGIITITHQLGAEIVIDATAITITDVLGNKVTMDATDMKIEDYVGQFITLGLTGIEMEDLTGNKISTTPGGIIIDSLVPGKFGVAGALPLAKTGDIVPTMLGPSPIIGTTLWLG